MIFRYPCKNCIVDPTCKDPCDKFGIFIEPIHKKLDWIGRVCEYVDDNWIVPKSRADKIFDAFGDYIFAPLVFYYIKFVHGVKAEKVEVTLFDERFTTWENRRPKK